MSMPSKLIDFIHRKKRLIIAVAIILALGMLLFLMLPRFIKLPTTKPPIVVKNTLTIIEADPTGKFESLDTTVPVSVRFNENLGSDVSGILVAITPSIPFKKYVFASSPNVLWIEPVTSEQTNERGWVDGVEYIITIGKGSKNASGSVLMEDYLFSFSNTSEGVLMYAD